MPLTLRPYQQECIDSILAAGPGSHLVVMATGLGKTVTFAALPRQGRTLILSHRDELVHQPEKYYDCSFGIEKGSEISNGEEVVSATVQSLSRDSRLLKFPPDYFDTIITDEAHHAIAPSYRKIVEHFEPRVHIGFTATPNRDDGRGLSKVFDDIVFERDLKWGILNGYLTDIDCRRVIVSWKTKGLRSQAGDFSIGELSRAVNTKANNEQVAAAYRQYAIGQTLVFASSVEHAYALAEVIPDSYVVDGKTPIEERRELIERFTAREIPVLINYGVFTEGTDLPLVETILLARPTKNQALYTQMVGRGLRLSPGKEFLRLIDCVGVSNANSICTAPLLFGFKEAEFSEAELGCIDGSLLHLEERMLEVDDTPVGWVLRDRKVDLLHRKDARIAWITLPGNRRVTAGTGWSVEMEGPDAVGCCKVRFVGETATTLRSYDTEDAAEKAVFDWLGRNPNSTDPQSVAIWNAQAAVSWADRDPTEKQIAYLASLMVQNASSNGRAALKELDELGAITRRECAVLIEIQKRKLGEALVERLGPCPTCGRHLKFSQSGRTLQCSSNVYEKTDGKWYLTRGCGFQMKAEIDGSKIPDLVIRKLMLEKQAEWRGHTLRLVKRGVGWYLAG